MTEHLGQGDRWAERRVGTGVTREQQAAEAARPEHGGQRDAQPNVGLSETWADEDEDLFCECGTTLLDGEGPLCATCRCAPHGRDCPCDECEAYWERICRESEVAAEKANRALVCSCGWTGAFIEHHNSEAYGPVARAGCEIVYRYPADVRQQLVRKAWNGSEWRQVGEQL